MNGKLVMYKPKAVSREANAVAEPTDWGIEATSTDSTLVSQAQTLLNNLGYDVDSPEGLPGDKTKAGIKRSQEQNGTVQTGELTAELAAKFEALAN